MNGNVADFKSIDAGDRKGTKRNYSIKWLSFMITFKLRPIILDKQLRCLLFVRIFKEDFYNFQHKMFLLRWMKEFKNGKPDSIKNQTYRSFWR